MLRINIPDSNLLQPKISQVLRTVLVLLFLCEMTFSNLIKDIISWCEAIKRQLSTENIFQTRKNAFKVVARPSFTRRTVDASLSINVFISSSDLPKKWQGTRDNESN